MPLVAHNKLPTLERLHNEGHFILSPERAGEQDIRPLHVGLLNMMPDTALEATERQFYRLVGSSNPISQFYIHPFTLPEIPRGDQARAHIAQYYESWQDIQRDGLDALIITGANVSQPDLAKEVYWEPLKRVIDWAFDSVTSTLCSCLASHAVLQFSYGQQRQPLQNKCWGVFEHTVVDRSHPFVHDVNTRLHVPHSRFNEVTRQQFLDAGLHILIEGPEPGVQLAVSADGFRQVFFQGHPEYDQISLLKEYKREVGRFIRDEIQIYPPFPCHYFDQRTRALLNEYEGKVVASLNAGRTAVDFPEHLVRTGLHNTWHDSGEALVGNWIGCVYQMTDSDRRKPFMQGVDASNPLDWVNARIGSGPASRQHDVGSSGAAND